MFQKNLLNFSSLNETLFKQLMHDLGFTHAAVYRIEKGELNFVFGSEPPKSLPIWPVSIAFEYLNYNANEAKGLPLGWNKLKLPKTVQNLLPSSTLIYFPEQELSPTKLVLVLIPLRRRRMIEGELHGELEAILHRLRHFIDSSELRTFINEVAFDQHIRKLSIDLQTLIDHELRTPLSIILGYLQLSRPEDSKLQEFLTIIEKQVNVAIESTQKLGMVLRSSFETYTEKDIDAEIDLVALMAEIVREIKGDTKTMRSTQIVFVHPEDKATVVMRGIIRLVKRAIYEVVHNAVVHSPKGNVRLTLYTNDNSLVLDVEDDGEGVPVGSEDLIFLRFFQGTNATKSKRNQPGLGLGLYLARHIAEQHSGKLSFIRQGKNGLFRFVFPLANGKEVPFRAKTVNH